MEEMKKDENLETQETVVEETAETVEAEVVEETIKPNKEMRRRKKDED